MKSGFKWVLGILSLGGLIGFASNKKAEKIGEVSKTEVGPQVEKAKNEELKRESNDVDKNNSKSVSEKEDIKVFNVGEEGMAGKHGVTIINVIKGYEKNTFFKPVDGNQLILVTVKIKNKSDSRISYSSSNFKIKDKHGNIIRQEAYNYGKGLNSGQLEANGEVEGTLTFQVPKDNNEFSILYDPAFIFSKEIEFKI